MDKYNAKHYWDETAALAIARAGRRKKDVCAVRGGYFIGEIYRLAWKNGVLEIWKAK